MAKADLLVSLVHSGMRGDKPRFRKIVAEISANERAKSHDVLAEKLEEMLTQSCEDSMINGNATVASRGVENLYHEIVPRRSFSDLVLPPEVLNICNDLVAEHHRADVLRAYNMEPRSRVLLIGPPGNGKTSLAEALAEALMLPLLVVRYESIVGTYLGETAARLQKLFDHAVTRRCVLFFDEFETLGKERGDIHETGEIKRVVSSLLLQVDSLPSHTIVVGATNHPELLDRAAWRRFQVRLNLPSPTQGRLAEWFKKFESRVGESLNYSPADLAKQLKGASFSDAEEFGQAVMRKYILERPDVGMRDVVSKMLKERATGAATANQK